jgi:undecaprenyl-diphosphatase
MSLSSWLEKLHRVDLAGFYLINGSLRNAFFDTLMPFITDKWNAALPLALLFLYVLLFRPKRDRILVIAALAVVLVADATTQILKNLFHRIRPCDVLEKAICWPPLAVHLGYANRLAGAILLYGKDLFQYVKDLFQPGGAAITGINLKGVVRHGSFSFPSNHASNIFALAAYFSYNYRRLALPCFVAAFLVGYSRIYLGAHYPMDVLAGAAWGMFVGFFAAVVAERLMRARRADDPIRPAEKQDSSPLTPTSSSLRPQRPRGWSHS